MVWRHAAHTITLLGYPHEWDEDEGYHVYFANCVLNWQPIYSDINQMPMFPQTYPPVHTAVLALDRVWRSLPSDWPRTVVAQVMILLIVQAIREKRVPLIIMEPRLVPEEVVSAVSTNYRTLEKQPISMNTWWGRNTYRIGVPK